MKKQLVIICALTALFLAPSLSFADKLADAQRQILESSNKTAWQMLEDGVLGETETPSQPTDLPSMASRSFTQPDNTVPSGDDIPMSVVPAATLPPQIPEPTTIILLGLGLIGLGARRKIRQ
jgi:hypothetical protein